MNSTGPVRVRDVVAQRQHLVTALAGQRLLDAAEQRVGRAGLVGVGVLREGIEDVDGDELLGLPAGGLQVGRRGRPDHERVVENDGGSRLAEEHRIQVLAGQGWFIVQPFRREDCTARPSQRSTTFPDRRLLRGVRYGQNTLALLTTSFHAAPGHGRTHSRLAARRGAGAARRRRRRRLGGRPARRRPAARHGRHPRGGPARDRVDGHRGDAAVAVVVAGLRPGDVRRRHRDVGAPDRGTRRAASLAGTRDRRRSLPRGRAHPGVRGHPVQRRGDHPDGRHPDRRRDDGVAR